MAKNAGYLSAPAKATPMSQSMQALSLYAPLVFAWDVFLLLYIE
jgi:hypothetical protein